MQTKHKNISVARKIAIDTLIRVERDNAFAANLLAKLDNEQVNNADRRLAQDLVLGVLRWRLQLDYLIESYADRSAQKLDLPVLLALRLGIYQIRFLDRIPNSAA